ncbi:S-formylglutathione hydrolase [Vibrio tarriae]|uniref:S-formylglutathione hydrolase n=1 Tax=Vibrio tarriae TaxID=2014742 RepID=UPI000DE2AC20|nr:S-formylglutathione hydrolase [Vibrio tarriae]RBM28719.1 S-formylglutathione hydrolase [Vibrio tarriae]
MVLTHLSQSRVFQGWHKQYQHRSEVLNCMMRFSIFLPPQATNNHKVPVLYWLSGLTCNDENFMQKAAAFEKAAELGLVIVAADTSPRGEGVADDPDGQYDLGLGAGFYLNATQQPWKRHYQMYDYIAYELPKLIEENFPVTQKKAIAGHSMGGHGALTIGLRNQGHYCSISAFSPICHPINAPWGQKAFRHYLGENTEDWQQYDTVQLLKTQPLELPILIDQGMADPFLEEQLQIEALKQVIPSETKKIEIRQQPGYDHSYFFIQSFIAEHLTFHWQHLSV